MDDHESTSSGLLIGLIAGGVVVLLLLVAGAIGVCWFFLAEARMEEAAAVHELEAVARDVEVAVKDLDAAIQEIAPPPVPAPKELDKDQARFLGSWETTWPDGTKARMQFFADGTLRLHKESPDGDTSLTITCSWDVLESKGGRVVMRRAHANKNYVVEQAFQLQGNDRFVIHGPFPENDRWVVKGPDGMATYQRTK